MSAKLAINSIRESFKLKNKEQLQWFPGHMTKGLRQMQQKLKMVDCIVEVHDSRIPFSGRNPNLKKSIKPHILVLNKKDLISRKCQEQILEKYKATQDESTQIIFTNCKDQQCNGVKKIFPLMKDLIKKSQRFNRNGESDYCTMIIGVPNVGKSSLINILRNKNLGYSNATKVGSIAGITRSVLNKIKICQDPLVYLIDTPGILTPNVKNIDSGMRLALCSCLPDHLVGPELIADYLLYMLNKTNNFNYLNKMCLDEPTDDIEFVLLNYANKMDLFEKFKDIHGNFRKRPKRDEAANYFIKCFREGKFGKICLDNDCL